jgi:hypothetical protein
VLRNTMKSQKVKRICANCNDYKGLRCINFFSKRRKGKGCGAWEEVNNFEKNPIVVTEEWSQDADEIRTGGCMWWHKATCDDGVVRVGASAFRNLPCHIQERIKKIRKHRNEQIISS